MVVTNLKGEEVMKEIKTGISVVNYFATWCGPCQMFAPILEELSKEVKVFKINIDQNKDFAKDKGIKNIPQTFFYKDGELKDEHNGFASIEALQEKINSL